MPKFYGRYDDETTQIRGRVSFPQRAIMDYNMMTNKPSIEDVVLTGNKTLTDFGDVEISNTEIQNIIDSVFS